MSQNLIQDNTELLNLQDLIIVSRFVNDFLLSTNIKVNLHSPEVAVTEHIKCVSQLCTMSIS